MKMHSLMGDNISNITAKQTRAKDYFWMQIPDPEFQLIVTFILRRKYRIDKHDYETITIIFFFLLMKPEANYIIFS